MTPATLQKLREAFLLGCSDREACFFAEISPSSLYAYQQHHPDFLEQKELWKADLTFKARRVVVDAINTGDLRVSQWYLERKAKDEFGLRTEHVGKNGEPIEFVLQDFTTDDVANLVSEKGYGATSHSQSSISTG